MLITVAVLVVVALIAVLVIAQDDDDETGSSTTAGQSSATGEESTSSSDTSGPDGTTDGGDTSSEPDLAVVDKGFSIIEDESDGPVISYGVMIENTSDEVAIICDITSKFVDDSDAEVATDTGPWLSAVLPGQTFGIGFSGLDFNGEPTAMQVSIDAITFDNPDEHGEITVDGLDTTVDGYGRPTTTFTATSSYDQDLPEPFAWVIYRNADGEVIGGHGSYMEALTAGGSVDDEVTAGTRIEDIDESQTEIFIEPVQVKCDEDGNVVPP